MPSDLPSPGLGTSGNTDFEECAETVREAIEMGYRHVDTAQMYDNEEAVGEGIERADVDREEVFVATKILPGNLAPGDVTETIHDSLDRLGLDQVDLLYVHWPMRAYEAAETLPAFDELHEEGLTRHVGVSNFTPELLDEARQILDAPIFAHQVECHPWLQQDELRKYARVYDHHLVAYAPIMQGRADEEPVLVEIAGKHDATPYQVALAWLESLESVVPIPKGTGDHVRENWEARKIELDAEDREQIADIETEKRLVDPDGAPWNR